MKLLILPDVGRTHTSVRPEAEIYISLAKLGHEVIIMTDLTGAYVPFYKQHNIELIELVPNKKIDKKAIQKIKEVILSRDIDVVYATKSRTIPNAVFACRNTKAKLVAYRGTTGGLYWHDPSSFISILHPRIDGVICVADVVTKHVKSKIRKKTHPFVQTIYKGHDLSWYEGEVTDLSTFGVPENSFNVFCVGSDRSHKGLKYLLEATHFLGDLKKLNIILAGDKLEKFSHVIADSPMSERIYQLGFRNDVPQLAGACDVLVLPSLREGLSRAVLESLAYSTPVITSDCGGPTEMIEDGVNGYVVPIKDSQAIAEKIRKLYESPEILKAFEKACQKTILTKMSHNETVKNYENYFRAIIAS